MKRFRYCNYLGKYFCNTCQSSKPTFIPARIIRRWDFKEYPFKCKAFLQRKSYLFSSPAMCSLHQILILLLVLHAWIFVNLVFSSSVEKDSYHYKSFLSSLTMFKYEVSTFARDLLSRVHNDPLFNVQAINKTLYKKVKEMDGVKV